MNAEKFSFIVLWLISGFIIAGYFRYYLFPFIRRKIFLLKSYFMFKRMAKQYDKIDTAELKNQLQEIAENFLWLFKHDNRI